MPTEGQKQDALVSFIEETLATVRPDPNVSDRFREARTAQLSERNRVMGDPVYYAKIAREGYRVSESSQRSTGGAPYQPAHEYGVRLWLEYEDTDERKAEWDELVEGENGLLPTLRQQEAIEENGNTYNLRQPENVDELVVSLSNRGPNGEKAYYLEFSIVVTHKIDC